MELVTVVAAVPAVVGAIWELVQIFEKVVNFRLNRKKLQEEIRKLERENNENDKKLSTVDDQENSAFLFESRPFLTDRLKYRGALPYYESVQERLLQARIRIVDAKIEFHKKGRDIKKISSSRFKEGLNAQIT